VRRRPAAVPLLSDAFFRGYTGSWAVAGGAGAALARAEAVPISGFHPRDELAERAAATTLCQHRFPRAMGFGMFSLHERDRIRHDRSANRRSLSLVVSGVAARALARFCDGRPRAIACLLGGSELLGLAPFAHSRSTLRR
jgi:hypothetical protein